jgi:hypothetical protein
MKLILSAMLVATVLVACAPRAATPSATSTSTGTSAPTVAAMTTTPAAQTPSTTQSATTGTISGFTGYPAEGNPAMTIYAVSTTDRSVYFTVDVPRGTAPTKPLYTINGVRPGTYHLLAYVGDEQGPAGAAYTEYVKCGMRASCSDHSLIAVTVRAGEAVRDIEVNDWYAPQGTFPSRPR